MIGRKCNFVNHTERLLKIILDYLEEKGEKGLIDVNAFDLDGRTPLMHLWFRPSLSTSFVFLSLYFLSFFLFSPLFQLNIYHLGNFSKKQKKKKSNATTSLSPVVPPLLPSLLCLLRGDLRILPIP